MGNSIIQSTLVRISILIFCIFLVLYFYIARIYWDKEVNQRELELLTIASSSAIQIQGNIELVNSIKEDTALTEEQKKEKIYSLLLPHLQDISISHPGIIIGFHDYEMNSAFSFSSKSDVQMDLSSLQLFSSPNTTGQPEFLLDDKLTAWDGKGVIGVTVPANYNGESIGHIWAAVNSDRAIFDSYTNYAKVLLLGIVIWLLALMIIKRYLKNIERSLDSFTQMVIDNDFEDVMVVSRFPELMPVFERIKTHLNKLTELNSELENSNEKMLTIMEGIEDGFYSLDKEWRFTFLNKEARKTKDNKELLGKNIWDEYKDELDPLTVDKLQEAARERKPIHWEVHCGMENKYYEYNAYPFSQGISVFFRDITDSKHQENEIVRLERLNLIGQLAAGISHEVRNPLTIVRGFLQLLESQAHSDRNKEYMEIMISEIDRANGIITDFLSLAKVNAEKTKVEDLNEVVMRIFPMLQADAFNSNKDVVLNLGDIQPVELNESEIRQLILNLVRNGLEETPEEGQVTICTYIQEDQVVLAIRDQGNGIPKEIMEKMGTPFLTTKETGTGLGLAISMGIANRHKAKFEFDTGKNGTTFFIKLPIKNI